jgi:hypothetical protein
MKPAFDFSRHTWECACGLATWRRQVKLFYKRLHNASFTPYTHLHRHEYWTTNPTHFILLNRSLQAKRWRCLGGFGCITRRAVFSSFASSA